MSIPTPRIFPNPNALPFDVVYSRLQALDRTVRLDLIQSGPIGGIVNQVLVWSTALTDPQITNALSTTQSAAETTTQTTKDLAHASKSTSLVASGLIGTNISAANSNAARDALMKAICMALSICDENGVIINI